MIYAQSSGNPELGAFGYAWTPDRGDHCLVDVDMIAIPGPGEASVADPSDLLGPGNEPCFSYSYLVKPKSEWPSTSFLKSKRIRCDVKPNQYPTLVKRLVEANMVQLLNSDDSVMENSVFGVWKTAGVSQRLIWAGNRSNLLFRKEASSVELPTPDIVSSLFLDEGSELHISGCDLSQYHNRLRAPPELVPLLWFPRLEAKLLGLSSPSGILTPCLSCIPMGASFAVAIAQRVTSSVLRSAGLQSPTPFSGLLGTHLRRGSFTPLPYIDDITIIGTSAQTVNSARDKAARSFRSSSLPTEPAKNVDAVVGAYSIAIGLAWWHDGTLTVKPGYAQKLFVTTNRIVSSRWSSPRELQHAVGLWNWALLLRRPAFSVLFYCYAFMLEAEPDKRRRLPESVVVELSILPDLFPLLFADLSRPLESRIYCSDASELGAGLVYSDLSTRSLWRFKSDISETRCRKGWYTTLLFHPECDSEFISSAASSSHLKLKVSKQFEQAISSQSFKTAVRSRWKWSGDKINKLETEAFLIAI